MSNCKECLVCGSYTSGIREAFEDGDPCPHCGALYETTLALEKAEKIRANYVAKKAASELVEENKKLRDENILLRDKVGRLYGNLWCIDYKIDEAISEWKSFKDSVALVKEEVKDE